MPDGAHQHGLGSRFLFALEGLLPHPGPGRLDPFEWTVRRRGEELVVRLDVPRHFHVNRSGVEVVWVDAAGERPVVLPPGEIVEDPSFGPVEQFRKDLELRIPVGAGPGRLRVRHQGCRDDLCYPPVTREIAVP